MHLHCKCSSTSLSTRLSTPATGHFLTSLRRLLSVLLAFTAKAGRFKALAAVPVSALWPSTLLGCGHFLWVFLGWASFCSVSWFNLSFRQQCPLVEQDKEKKKQENNIFFAASFISKCVLLFVALLHLLVRFKCQCALWSMGQLME